MATWIKIEDELPYIHKVASLRRLLKLTTTREAVSYLIMLWLYTLKVAWRTGDLSAYGDEMVEEACEWRGEPGALVKALRECGRIGPSGRESGFLDGYVVHDWVDRASRLIRDRVYREEKRTEDGYKGEANTEAVAVYTLWNDYAKEHKLAASARAPRLPEGMTSAKFQLVLEAASMQPFLLGSGAQHWRMDLGWLLRPDNTEAVLANRYFVREGGKLPAAVESDPGGYRARTKEILARRKEQGIQ